VTSQQPNPYEAPKAPDGAVQLQPLSGIPFYRQNGTASALLFIALALGFGGPMILAGALSALGLVGSTLAGLVLGAPLLAVCVIVLTGNVYYDTYDAEGRLKKWGVGNKIVAFLIMAGWLYSIVNRFI